jgi:hypothetical protein
MHNNDPYVKFLEICTFLFFVLALFLLLILAII